MAMKPSYVVDGQIWIPMSRAASLLVTNAAGVKKLMGNGKLEFTNVPRGKSILVEQAGVLRLRDELGTVSKEAARRARAATRTAAERGKALGPAKPR